MKLIVIDMQKGLLDDELYRYREFVRDTLRIISEARDSGIEVIYVQHDAGPGTGLSEGDEDFEIAEEVAPKKGESVFVKTINSCFGNRDLASYLKENGEDTLMIVGLQTNFCIDASVKSAFERGYHVIIPEGTNSTFDNDYMTGETTCAYYFNEVWPDLFADCVSLEEAIELIHSFGSQK